MRALVSLLLAVPVVLAVKSADFKTCDQAAFCRRGRALSSRAHDAKSWQSPYSVDAASVALQSDQSSFTAAVKSALYPDIHFGLDVRIHNDGVVRVKMDEVGGLRKRYDEAASWALIAEPQISHDIKWKVGKKDIRAVYGPKEEFEIVVSFAPLKVTLLRGGKEQVVLNGQGLLHMEHFRKKAEEAALPEGADQQVVMKANPHVWFEGETEDGCWEEKFGTSTDSKPKGEYHTSFYS